MQLTRSVPHKPVTRGHRALGVAMFLVVAPTLAVFLAPIAILTLPLLFIIAPLVLSA